jgi:hypothetical protein
MRNGIDGLHDVAHPGPNSLHFVYHWAERISFLSMQRDERTLRILIVNPAIRRSRTSFRVAGE